MANSAQLTTSVSYPIPANFKEGIANKVQIPIPANIALAEVMNNFIVNAAGNLEFSGGAPAKIDLRGGLSFGTFIPSQVPPPPLPLDSGPKVKFTAYAQVGSQVGLPTSIVFTIYYPAFEWASSYSIETLDTLTFSPGDEVTFWAYYEWIIPPVAPVDPNTFYVNIEKCNLSLTAFSSIAVITRNLGPMSVDVSSSIQTVPIGPNVNSVLFTFKPHVSGPALVELRMNIPMMKAFKNSTGTYAPLIVGITDFIYLSVNGDLTPRQVAYAFSGNQPFVSNGDTIFPSTLVTRLLADFKQSDEVSVIYNSDNVFIVDPSSPAGFSILTDGKLTAQFNFNAISTEELYVQASVQQTADTSVTVPIGTNLNTAVEYPMTDCKINSSNFQLDGKTNYLTYIGEHQSWFKIKGIFNYSNLELKNANADVPVVSLGNFGFLIGVDGQRENNVVTETEVYTNVAGTFSLMSSNSFENAFRVRPGERISLLLYTNNVVYTIAPPVPGVVVKVPPPNSTVVLTGRLVLTIE